MSKLKSGPIGPIDSEEHEWRKAEEEEILHEIPEREFKELKRKLTTAAKNTVQTRKMISIKIRESDLSLLKEEAEQKGLRYQSLINSILHQYVTRRLNGIKL